MIKLNGGATEDAVVVDAVDVDSISNAEADADELAGATATR